MILSGRVIFDAYVSDFLDWNIWNEICEMRCCFWKKHIWLSLMKNWVRWPSSRWWVRILSDFLVLKKIFQQGRNGFPFSRGTTSQAGWSCIISEASKHGGLWLSDCPSSSGIFGSVGPTSVCRSASWSCGCEKWSRNCTRNEAGCWWGF